MTQSPAAPLPPPKERRRLREAGSLTQAQIAERVGVTRETVRAWESGRTNPRGRRREAYAKLLGKLAEEPGRRPEVTKPQEAREVEEMPEAPAVVDDDRTDEAQETRETKEAREAREARGASEAQGARKARRAREARGAREAERVVGALAPEPDPDPEPGSEPGSGADSGAGSGAGSDSPSPPLTPAQAFDALYAFCAPALVRQTYLLTGRRELARESVERAFELAWQRWPEVAVDRDPAGWVRSTAYEYALSPWHRFRPRYRHPEPPPADVADRALLGVLLKLPAPHRRTLLLYDGVGLDLPETAAETEASTPATANRLLHARETVAAALPDLAEPAVLHRRLAELASGERLRAARPPTVRTGSERRARFWTRAAIAFTVALIGTTALTIRTAPTHYEPPVAPGAEIEGVPARVGQGPLSDAEVRLRHKLRETVTNGPERLSPLIR
ncbi:helix-turn-helix domain-containing protein [Streptomyces sp. NPDC090106]|uniref:helix-turn-helix domain-containing protein n=1 Tax=Streptomyces sp. NPDC090106 TaxID=3365946 RepID=UPI0037FDAA30